MSRTHGSSVPRDLMRRCDRQGFGTDPAFSEWLGFNLHAVCSRLLCLCWPPYVVTRAKQDGSEPLDQYRYRPCQACPSVNVKKIRFRRCLRIFWIFDISAWFSDQGRSPKQHKRLRKNLYRGLGLSRISKIRACRFA